MGSGIPEFSLLVYVSPHHVTQPVLRIMLDCDYRALPCHIHSPQTGVAEWVVVSFYLKLLPARGNTILGSWKDTHF